MWYASGTINRKSSIPVGNNIKIKFNGMFWLRSRNISKLNILMNMLLFAKMYGMLWKYDKMYIIGWLPEMHVITQILRWYSTRPYMAYRQLFPGKRTIPIPTRTLICLASCTVQQLLCVYVWFMQCMSTCVCVCSRLFVFALLI